jgi:hypothetical protein
MAIRPDLGERITLPDTCTAPRGIEMAVVIEVRRGLDVAYVRPDQIDRVLAQTEEHDRVSLPRHIPGTVTLDWSDAKSLQTWAAERNVR